MFDHRLSWSLQRINQAPSGLQKAISSVPVAIRNLSSEIIDLLNKTRDSLQITWFQCNA